MNRENNDLMNSVYLSEFRKKKNQMIASEIDPYEDDIPPDASLSGDSSFLETFRYRKNTQLAAELTEEDRAYFYAETPEDIEGGIPLSNGEQAITGRKQFRRRGSDMADNAQSSADLSDDFFDEDVDAQNSFSKPVQPALSNQITEFDKHGRNNSKLIVVFFIFAISLCGIFIISKMNRDRTNVENGDISAFPGEISQTDYLESELSDQSTTDDSSMTSTTEESTTEKVETTTTSEAIHYEALSPGQRSDDVLKMQNRLKQLGYISQDSCTGYYGDYTKKMIKMFQKKAGLKQTGVADPKTLARLYSDDAPNCFN